jgi:hypothetical protein
MSDRHCEACGQVRLPKDVNHMNLQELEALVLKHEQQIKDIAKHLLELQQYMEFKRREWVGLTDEDIKDIVPSCTFSCVFLLQCDLFKKIEDKLREKNGG